jgi:hypothetical protein
MPSIHLELIVETDSNYGNSEHIDLPVAIHVHKRLEQFIYTSAHKDPTTVIAYIENPPVDSKNLRIVNKTSTVPENNHRLVKAQNTRFVSAKSVTVEYSHILATNISTMDSNGKEAPLFWKHLLPVGVTGVTLRKVEDGIDSVVDTGFLVDLSARSLYTNYTNEFDESTGKVTVYYVYPEYDSFTTPETESDRFLSSTSEDEDLGGSGDVTDFQPSTITSSSEERTKQLLSLRPVVTEATWEDIDVSTGNLYPDRQVYVKTTTPSGTSFAFNKGDKWWVRPYEEGMIQPIAPINTTPDYGWYLHFTNGDFRALVNSKVRRFYVPEFNYQNFVPYKPIRYTTYDLAKIATKNLLFTNRKSLMIDPSLGLNLTLFIYDESDILLRVLTTDSNLSGTRYRDSVFYEGGLIDGYDNTTGCIAVGLDIFSNHKVVASYYYKANAFEYKLVNVNPLINSLIRDKLIVFYCVPDVDEADRAIHYLLVDTAGKINYCSQGLGVGHSNLQLKNLDGTFNIDSVIGMKYFSEIDADNFINLFTAGYNNTYGYMLICELTISDYILEENQEVIEILEPGAQIKAALTDTAILANPKIQNSALCNAPFGLQIPEENVIVVEPPYSLLEEYGGVLSRAQAESLLRTLMPVTGYMAMNWTYPKSTVTGYYNDEGVVIDISFEGLYDYKIFRSSQSEEKTLLTTFSPINRTELTYTDTSVQPTTTYTYYISLTENDITYPETVVKVRVP